MSLRNRNREARDENGDAPIFVPELLNPLRSRGAGADVHAVILRLALPS